MTGSWVTLAGSFDETPLWRKDPERPQRRKERRASIEDGDGKFVVQLETSHSGRATVELSSVSVRGLSFDPSALPSVRHGKPNGTPARITLAEAGHDWLEVHFVEAGSGRGMVRLPDPVIPPPRPDGAESSGASAWLRHVLRRLNPAIAEGIWKFQDEELRQTVEKLLRLFGPQDAQDRFEAFFKAYLDAGGAEERGWVVIAEGRWSPDGHPVAQATEHEPLGVLCFQPMSNGVVFGHQLSLLAPMVGDDSKKKSSDRWACAQVRKVLYLAGFERLEYMPWAKVLTGVYIYYESAGTKGGWMVDVHGGFARELVGEHRRRLAREPEINAIPCDDVVDFPILLSPMDAKVLTPVDPWLVDPLVEVRLGSWDDATREAIRATVRRMRSELYCESVELHGPLTCGATPFVVSTSVDDDWCVTAGEVSGAQSRARRSLEVVYDGVLVARGIVDAVNWPVNLTGLLDAVRLYPTEAFDPPRELLERRWRAIRWAALARAAAFYRAVGVGHFVYINEPISALTDVDDTKPLGLGLPWDGCDPKLRPRESPGRYWSIRRGRRHMPPGRRTVFAEFAEFAERWAQMQKRAAETEFTGRR